MLHRSSLVLAYLGVGLLVAGPTAEQSPQIIKGWGQVLDPDRDCRITTQDGGVRIAVPGGNHDLWPKGGKVNAPRILHDVDGDFTVQVKVAGTVKPSDGFFRAGTLLVWQDEGTFVRFDIAAADRGASRYDFFAYLHVFKNGDRTVNEQIRPLQDSPTLLRIERLGSRIVASFSQDEGTNWRAFGSKTVELSRQLKVGVAALNNTKTPFVAAFEDLRIMK